MKKILLTAALGLSLGFSSATMAQVATYTDSVGDVFTGAGDGILDITGLEITNNETDIIFRLFLDGDPAATDWGKYMIGIDSGLGGDIAGNGWDRPIAMSSGMNYWIGTWVDGGNGGQFWSWTGSEWNMEGDPVSVTKDSSSVTIQFQFAGLGLNIGESFDFDIYSSGTGDGDGAIDAIANPNQTVGDWGDFYDSDALVYTYTLVPEPATYALLLLGGLAFAAHRLRRRG